MSEILFFAEDRISDDPYTDAKAYKRGMGITVQQDEWRWGEGELTTREWRILRAAKVDIDHARSLLSPELDTDPANPSRMLQRNGFRLDLDDPSLPEPFKAWLRDDTRALPIYEVDWTPEQFAALVKQKPSRIDPNIL